MAVAQSKDEQEEVAKQRRKRLLRLIEFSVFQSVAQHVIVLQSEPQMMDAICNGDVVRSAQILSNTSGIVAVLSIILNQVGGKFSDAVGRKPCLLLGPLCNVILGLLPFKYPASKLTILVCRVLRMCVTTFSNTVIVNALMVDSFTGPEMAVAGAEVSAVVGVAIAAAPFVEGSILSKTKSPRLSFLLLSILGALHSLCTCLTVPETLEAAKRLPMKAVLHPSTLNPFGFLNIFTKGSLALKKIAIITSLQGFIEGKNLSDFALAFMKENMKWSVEGIRNWTTMFGLTNLASAATLSPYLLKTLSVRGYTRFTNWTNLIAYIIRAFVEGRTLLWLSTVPLMLPGVNGMGATALKAVGSNLATAEGFGAGEFSAYYNNLRAIVSALAPIMFGNWYAWAQRKGFGGSTYWLVAIFAAAIPELMLQFVTDSELKIKAAAK